MEHDLSKHIPEIIEASAKSPLGILALAILGLGILAYFFFKGAPVKVRVGIFVMLFIGVVGCGMVVLSKTQAVAERLGKVESAGPALSVNEQREEISRRLDLATHLTKEVSYQGQKVKVAQPNEWESETEKLNLKCGLLIAQFPILWNGYADADPNLAPANKPFSNSTLETIVRGYVQAKFSPTADTSRLLAGYNQELSQLKTAFGQFKETWKLLFQPSGTFDGSATEKRLAQDLRRTRFQDFEIAHAQLVSAMQAFVSSEPFLSLLAAKE